jgi:hypothetical protein
MNRIGRHTIVYMAPIAAMALEAAPGGQDGRDRQRCKLGNTVRDPER